MEITSVQFFEAIREFNWRQLQEWFNSNVKVSFPDKSEWSIFRLNGPTGRVSPERIQTYITWGMTSHKHSPVEALFLQKGHFWQKGECTTNFSPYVLHTYYTLVSNGASTLTDHQAYGDSCLDPARNNPIINEIDLYCLFLRHQHDGNPYHTNALKRYFRSIGMQDEWKFNEMFTEMKRRIMAAIGGSANISGPGSNSSRPHYGGRRTRQRRLRKTRRR
jgi:hypothetical protein